MLLSKTRHQLVVLPTNLLHNTTLTDDAIPQATDLQQYQLAKDREERKIRLPARYAYADMVAYT